MIIGLFHDDVNNSPFVEQAGVVYLQVQGQDRVDDPGQGD